MCALTAAGAAAQDLQGRDHGRVSDMSGGRSARRHGDRDQRRDQRRLDDRHRTRKVRTRFRISPPGKYSVVVELAGFKKNRARRHRGPHRRSAHAAISRMDVRAIEETVLVTAQSPLLEMGSASAGQVIDEKRIALMPLSDGNPFVLSRLVPGVAFTGDLKFSRPFDNAGTSGINADGASGGNEFTLDGSPNMTSGRRVAFVPPAGAVQQFKVGTASFDAADGHTAGAGRQRDAQERHQQPQRARATTTCGATSSRRPTSSWTRPARRSRDLNYNRPGGYLGRADRDPNRTFFFGAVEWLVRHVPRAAAADGADAGDAQRRLSRRCSRRATIIYDPLTAQQVGAPRRARSRSPATSSRPNRINPDRRRRAEVLSAAQPGRVTTRAGTTSSM